MIGCVRDATAPNFSDISTVWEPLESVQSNLCTRLERVSSIIRRPRGFPGQARLPIPNERIWDLYRSNFVSLKFISQNLSGINSSGLVHTWGSFAMAHAFTKTLVPWGIWYPPNLHDLVDMRGSSKGAGMCLRNVSFITALQYGKFGKSVVVTNLSSPTTWFISCFSFLRIYLLDNNSASPQSRVTDEVSIPAARSSYKMSSHILGFL